MKHLAIILIILLGIATCAFAFEMPSSLRIQPVDDGVAKIYFGLLDRDLDALLPQLDEQSGLLKADRPPSATSAAGEELALTPEERRARAENPQYIWSYHQTRRSAELVGALACAYAYSPSKYHHDPTVLQRIRSILKAFAAHQADDGEFVFSPIHYSSVWGTHEMAWRLEPLLSAFLLIQNDLPAGERKTIEGVLQKGMEYLYQHENHSYSNRGMVWCAVMALASHCTGNAKYMEAANRVFERIRTLFDDSGEVREGPGPDLGYSAISIQYLFLYRRVSGRQDLDEILLRSLEWYTRLFTTSAVPLEGMSTRTWQSGGSKIAGLMEALTYYGDRNPDFLQIATHYLEDLIKMPGGFTPRYDAGHFLRGVNHHHRPHELQPVPYQPYARLYQSDHSLYFLVGKNYQTAVTLRGRQSLKGLQTWSYKGQPPVIFPSPAGHSRIMGFGYDSSLIDASWESEKTPYRHTHLESDVDVLVVEQGSLISAFLFAPDTTVVIYHDPSDRKVVDWAVNAPQGAEIAEIQPTHVTYRNTDARILMPNIQTDLVQQESSTLLRSRYTNAFCWFIFCGPESNTIVQPVLEGMILVQIEETGVKTNLVVNLANQSFMQARNFPGTSIPIPSLDAYSTALIPAAR